MGVGIWEAIFKTKFFFFLKGIKRGKIEGKEERKREREGQMEALKKV